MVSNGARRVGACQSARAGRSAPLAVSGLLTFGLLLLLLLAPSAARGATELGQLQPVALHQSCNRTNNLADIAHFVDGHGRFIPADGQDAEGNRDIRAACHRPYAGQCRGLRGVDTIDQGMGPG